MYIVTQYMPTVHYGTVCQQYMMTIYAKQYIMALYANSTWWQCMKPSKRLIIHQQITSWLSLLWRTSHPPNVAKLILLLFHITDNTWLFGEGGGGGGGGVGGGDFVLVNTCTVTHVSFVLLLELWMEEGDFKDSKIKPLRYYIIKLEQCNLLS